jgi:hypothetical protein
LILWGLLAESGRAEDGDARTHEMQSPKALDEFPSDFYGEVELFPSRLTALEELNFFTIWRHLYLPGEEDGTTPAIYQIC